MNTTTKAQPSTVDHCGRPRKSTVFSTSPITYIIPQEELIWQGGEKAESPSDYLLSNAKTLAARSSDEAASQEQRIAPARTIPAYTGRASRFTELFSLQGNAAALTPPPRAMAEHAIKRKSVPAPSQRTVQTVEHTGHLPGSTNHHTHQSTTQGPFPGIRRANTTFDDFLPSSKTSTWQYEDSSRWQRSMHGRVTTGLSKAREQMRRVKHGLD